MHDLTDKSLLFISYGQGLHEHEIAYAVWSIHSHRKTKGFKKILVYSDRPNEFSNLPGVVLVAIPKETWEEWGGPYRFNHRKKIFALQHALAEHGGSVVLLDGDTWFRKPVERLFDRVGPGRSLMHIREGNIGAIEGPRTTELRNLLDRSTVTLASGDRVSLTSHTDMWNAGVIGLHHSNRGLLDDVLAMTDQLCAQSDLHVLEQFAFSWVLSRKTKLSEAADVVFHYWPPYLHQPFRAKVEGLMARANQLPEDQRAEFLYQHRPRPTTIRRGKVILKRCAQALGLVRGRARTNEW